MDDDDPDYEKPVLQKFGSVDDLTLGKSPGLPSDRQLKSNIRDIDTGLDTVLALRPVSFEWTDNGDDTNFGLIAQEVAETLPEVVARSEDPDQLTVKYPDLIAILIDAIQTQQAEHEDLLETIDELRRRIDALEGNPSPDREL